MSVFGALDVYSQNDDRLIAAVSVVLAYLVIYPLYIFYLRNRHSRRIKRHLVTSAYKLPVHLTPTELAYVFRPKVNKNQLYAALLDLANRSLLIMNKEQNNTYVKIGPKIDDKILSFERYLMDKVKNAEGQVTTTELTTGSDSLKIEKNSSVKGSKSYIYWWLQRKSMRERKIIEKKMTSRYLMMLLKFGVFGGLLVSVFPLVAIRMAQMLDSGEVDFSKIVEHICNGLTFWLIVLVPLLIISFFLLRFRGKMLGRAWLLTSSFSRYLGQVDAFREYVRLSHKGKLRFESKELQKESIAQTRPYAIACGYIKP